MWIIMICVMKKQNITEYRIGMDQSVKENNER